MVKDRLAELNVSFNDVNIDKPNEVETLDDEGFVAIEMTPTNHKGSFIAPLIKRYHEIINDFEGIDANLEAMKIMLEAKNAHKFDASEFNKLRQKNTQYGNRVINTFKKLETKLPSQEDDDYSTKARMQRGLYYGFFEQYVRLWAKNEEVLQKYNQQLKKNLQMQSKIMNYDLTDEELDTLIENNQTNLLMDNILKDSEAAREQLKDLKNRLSDLRKLEKSIGEVHGLFLRLQTLVVEQGDVIQRIETHFNDARDWISQGNEDIKGAAEHRRQRFALRYKLILVGVIVSIIVLMIIVNSIHCFMFCKKK